MANNCRSTTRGETVHDGSTPAQGASNTLLTRNPKGMQENEYYILPIDVASAFLCAYFDQGDFEREDVFFAASPEITLGADQVRKGKNALCGRKRAPRQRPVKCNLELQKVGSDIC